MFFVFSKEKIYTYLVSVFTVLFLFEMVISFKNNKENTSYVSTNVEKLIPIHKVNLEEKKIAITINCVWNDNDIDKILENLKQNDVKITFFVTGNWVDKYPKTLQKIYNNGHEIGTLSDTYPHVNKLSYEENKKELELSSGKIKELTGKNVDLYRTPYGEYNDNVIKCAKDNNYNCIKWSIDTLDYTDITSNEIWKNIDSKLSSGDIIFMNNGTKHTANSLDSIIKNIKQRGYKIDTVSNLIYQDDYQIDGSGIQRKK